MRGADLSPGYRPVLLAIVALVAVHAIGLNVYPSCCNGSASRRMKSPPNCRSSSAISNSRGWLSDWTSSIVKNFRQTKTIPRKISSAMSRRSAIFAYGITAAAFDLRSAARNPAVLQFVDVDKRPLCHRRHVRQTMLSARELSHQHLQSRNWINEHLTFTHGHGVVFGPVNQVTPVGLRSFSSRNIPPVTVAED